MIVMKKGTKNWDFKNFKIILAKYVLKYLFTYLYFNIIDGISKFTNFDFEFAKWYRRLLPFFPRLIFFKIMLHLRGTSTDADLEEWIHKFSQGHTSLQKYLKP